MSSCSILLQNWESALPRYSSTDKGKATRVFSGIALNAVAQILPELIGGSADLTGSNDDNILIKIIES